MSEWKMVPAEPTTEMLKASFGYYGTADRYRAMLAAAPAPAFDEAAERVIFEEWWSGFYRVPVENLPHARTKHGYVGQPTHQAWMSWLACAKRKAGAE